MMYVKDQLLVSAYMGTPKEAVEAIAEEIGARIVGYIEISCDYQFEFTQSQSLETLYAIRDYLYGYPYIRYISLNTVSEIESTYASNDGLYNDQLKCYRKDIADFSGDYSFVCTKPGKDEWNEDNPEGDNWNLEKLKVPSAWDLVGDTQPVKVGIIDNYFCDVKSATGKTELHYEHIICNSRFEASNYGMAHGNHVAGIIAATHNNEYGISGIATNVKLYAYSYKEADSLAETRKDISIMGTKVALTTLICNHVKVINVCVAYGDHAKVYAASCDDTEYGQDAREKIAADAEIITEHLRNLINSGYDFLIVQAAGNNNGHYLVRDDNEKFGYREVSYGYPNAVSGGMLAQYAHHISAITDSAVKDRIIVVGASNKVDKFTTFSAIGDRVDVCAPGIDILSLAPAELDTSAIGSNALRGFMIMQGTSQAAPHISGIAALMFQVKPSLTAYRAKKILCDAANQVASIPDGNSRHPIPNAGICVQKSKNLMDIPAFDEDWPCGLVAGKIADADNNPLIKEIKIQAVRNNTGDFNLDKYAFEFGIDDNCEFLQSLPQGTYDFLFYTENNAEKYLPVIMRNIEILPNQTNYLETVRLQKWSSNRSQTVKGTVIDAFSGQPLVGATVRVRPGWGTQEGAYITSLFGKAKTDKTSSNGAFSLSLPMGAYTVEIEQNGYITGYYNVVSAGTSEMTMCLSPILPDDEYRIVLTWGETPNDLDSHLMYYKNGLQLFHVYFGDKKAYLDGELVASLDVDDVSSFGPETVTMTVSADLLENGELRYCVHNFTGGSKLLSESNATVRVYRGNKLLKTYNVTQNQQALVWHVFNLTASGIESVYKYDNQIR